MDIPKVGRSRFLAQCEQAVRSGLEALDAGSPVTVQFEQGGYPGRIQVKISHPVTDSFSAEWSNPDPTRFPARIRAAATALMNCGVIGRFLISHDDGVVTIVRI